MTGQKVLPYEIRERLGSGGMGMVYRPWDSKLSREVAIKFIRAPDDGAAPARVQRFLREARLASALNHPHTVTIHDIVVLQVPVSISWADDAPGRDLIEVRFETAFPAGEAYGVNVVSVKNGVETPVLNGYGFGVIPVSPPLGSRSPDRPGGPLRHRPFADLQDPDPGSGRWPGRGPLISCPSQRK